MAYRVIMHTPKCPEQMRELTNAIARFRAEKTLKYLGSLGDADQIIRDFPAPPAAPQQDLCNSGKHSK